MAELFPKRCKVYPRNGLQFIPGILEKQKRIEFPAELPLSEKELRRCLSYADVYEVTDSGDVLLTMLNFMADNSKATVATDVPDDKLQYPRDNKEEDEETDELDGASQEATASATSYQAKASTYTAKQQSQTKTTSTSTSEKTTTKTDTKTQSK